MALTKVSYSMITGTPANVLDYGADPTGVNDSTAAIQAALANSSNIFFPSGKYKISQITVTNPAVTFSADAPGGFYGGSGVTLITTSKTVDMIVVSNYEFKCFNILFAGASDVILKGTDCTNSAVRMQGATQKDLDSKFVNCTFFLFNTGVTANGTNVRFESCEFTNVTYGFKSSVAGGWENRAFLFKSCDFHSIGVTGSTSAGVFVDGAHNAQDVMISGTTLADDTTTLFMGFASGLVISDAFMPRARGTGIIIDTSTHGVAVKRRTAHVDGFTYFGNDAVVTTHAIGVIYAVGLLELCIENVMSTQCGGYGIYSTVDGAVIKNCNLADVGLFAHNTYDNYYVSGTNTVLTGISGSQDLTVVRTNKARYGLNIQASCFVKAITPIYGVASAPINVAAGPIQLTGDLPAKPGLSPSITWEDSIPTDGYYLRGSIVWQRAPQIYGVAPDQYIDSGWRRLTTGSNHVLGTDWVAIKEFIV